MCPSLDPADLMLFAQVADAGSFTRAADQLGMPKSTLSRRLSALETLLGERLMRRTTRRLTITEFGEAVLEHAREVVAQTDAALSLAEHRQAQPSGLLRVSMPADLAQGVLAPALARFARDHPRVRLELDLSPRRVDLIAENYDLVLRSGALLEDSTLHARRVATFVGGLYAAPQWLADRPGLIHPQQLMEAAQDIHALALGAPGHDPRRWSLSCHSVEGGQEVWTGLPARCTVANLPALLLEMAAEGLGVTAAAELLARPLLSSGRLVKVLPAWSLPPEAAWAVFPGRRLMPAKTRALVDALSDALAPCRESTPSEKSSAERHGAE